MDNTTMYEDDYVNCSQKQFKNARQANRRPPQTLTHTVSPPGDLLELRSHEHRHFGVPRRDLAKAERVEPPRQALEMGGAAVDPPKRSNYTREHIWLTASEPQLMATGHEKQKLQEVNWEILNIRRNPYTTPGN